MLGLDIPLSALGKGTSVPWVTFAVASSTRGRGITLCQAFPDPLAQGTEPALASLGATLQCAGSWDPASPCG